jgi:hypothetical protein
MVTSRMKNRLWYRVDLVPDSIKEIIMVKIKDVAIASETVEDAGLFPMQVSRPWYVYLMALYAFFGIAGFATSLSSVLFAANPDILTISRIIVLLVAIALVVNIIKMEKKYLITFGICCILLGVWQILNIGAVLLSGAFQKLPAAAVLLLFYVIPSCAMAVLVFRPKFLSIADKYSKFKKHEAMTKIALAKTV